MISDFSGSKSPFDIPKFRDQGDSPIEFGRLLAPWPIGVKPVIYQGVMLNIPATYLFPHAAFQDRQG